MGRKGEKSSWSYPPSLSSAPAAPSSTAPTNTKLLAASICCDPASLVHTPKGGDSYYLQYGTLLLGLSVVSGNDSAAPRHKSFIFQSRWLPPWNFVPSRQWVVERAEAERAPVKAWVGSGRLTQPALTYSLRVHDWWWTEALWSFKKGDLLRSLNTESVYKVMEVSPRPAWE